MNRKLTSGDPVRVLLIDDNADFTYVLSVLFECQNIPTTTCHSALAGLDFCSGFDYDAIVLDLEMPGMDGFQACEAMRKTERGSKTLIIAISGIYKLGFSEEVFEAGFDAYFEKRIDIVGFCSDLVRFIRANKRPGFEAGPS